MTRMSQKAMVTVMATGITAMATRPRRNLGTRTFSGNKKGGERLFFCLPPEGVVGCRWAVSCCLFSFISDRLEEGRWKRVTMKLKSKEPRRLQRDKQNWKPPNPLKGEQEEGYRSPPNPLKGEQEEGFRSPPNPLKGEQEEGYRQPPNPLKGEQEEGYLFSVICCGFSVVGFLLWVVV